MDAKTLKVAGRRLKAIREKSYDQETFNHDLAECIKLMLKGKLLGYPRIVKLGTIWTNKNFSGCADGTKPCCEHRNEYNGFGSGELKFVCPSHCSCHD